MKRITSQLGFTMIELLIVITILGILAVAVLSAINPIEQINRGRDTGTQSDAEQLLSAIDRYNAFQGYYPWQYDADDLDTSLMIDSNSDDGNRTDDTDIGLPWLLSENGPSLELNELDENGLPTATLFDCHLLERLSVGNENGDSRCAGSQELKTSFVNRMYSAGTRSLYIYNNGSAGSSTYVCFIPQSGAFETAALDRCATGLPSDIGEAGTAYICGTADDITHTVMSCVP